MQEITPYYLSLLHRLNMYVCITSQYRKQHQRCLNKALESRPGMKHKPAPSDEQLYSSGRSKIVGTALAHLEKHLYKNSGL